MPIRYESAVSCVDHVWNSRCFSAFRCIFLALAEVWRYRRKNEKLLSTRCHRFVPCLTGIKCTFMFTFPRFVPNSAFCPKCRVLSQMPRFIHNSTGRPKFRVVSPALRIISNTAFYSQFLVLAPFSRFIPNSLLRLSPIPRFAFYPLIPGFMQTLC